MFASRTADQAGKYGSDGSSVADDWPSACTAPSPAASAGAASTSTPLTGASSPGGGADMISASHASASSCSASPAIGWPGSASPWPAHKPASSADSFSAGAGISQEGN